MTKREITDEEYLLFLLEGYAIGLKGSMVCCLDNDDKPSIFMEGYFDALKQAHGSLIACMRLYDRKVKGEIPEEILELVRKKE